VIDSQNVVEQLNLKGSDVEVIQHRIQHEKNRALEPFESATCITGKIKTLGEWALQGSNLRPLDYESTALTD
jgi:hypothetical protein